ncbi:AI-2E family transporter [Pararhodonellum marinum]|uniref:AI-2E family transporter n=1 Tax=Pararhodonellum marinum TaxID=2755358 RepID=UPI00188F52F4|nr:AI-2E family transporter [Pararhodonellum marinum]
MQPNKIFTPNGILINFTLLVAGLFFFIYGLVLAKEFLAPLVLAFILAMLTFPLANKLESKGMKRIWTSIINILILLILAGLFFLVISWQMKTIVDDWDDIKDTILPKIEKAEAYILQHTPMDEGELEEYKSDMGVGDDEEESEEEEEENGDNGEKGEQALSVIGGAAGFLTDFLITFVYIFFFIHYRNRFKQFILKLFEKEKQDEVRNIISKSADVVQHYLIGRLLLMIVLVVLYGLGLWISGVENFIVVSIIAAILSLIPFVGNFFGYVLAMAMGVFSGGDMSTLIGVTVTFLFVQFLDSYILQPIVLGGKLNVHPFFIILSVILGNAIWGIVGMILAIPIFAIVSVVSRNVPAFGAFGYLFSSDEEES